MRIVCETNYRNLVLVLSILILLLFVPLTVIAAQPVLNFSDIDSGPKVGNSDGAGGLSSAQHGAIVTIWGNNLGSTQGKSKIYVGAVEVPHIYYWKDADGTLPGGPADLKTYHKMQEIAFAVPAGATDGANTIKVVIDGIDSNTLPFTVRTGKIYFVKSTGNNTTGDGSWGNPWLTLVNIFAGGNGKLIAGDTVFSVGVGSSTGLSIGASSAIHGTSANPVSLIAYPNSSVLLSGKSYNGYVIFNYNNQDDALASEYVNFSKIRITAAGDGSDSSTGIRAFKGNRVIGVEIAGPTVYGGYAGAISGNHVAAGGGKYYGIYIHNYGTDNGVPYAGNTGTDPTVCAYTNPACKNTWDQFQHLYYLSNRTVSQIEAYEIAWNHLTDNPIYQGIHIYDQGTVGGWSGTMKIHHNVVKNQRGGAIEAAYPSNVTTPMEIYNNIIISDIADTYNFRAFQLKSPGAAVKVYNNTIYGYNSSNVFQNASTDYRNNLMVDTKGITFIYDSLTTQSNNLFYSTGSTPKPTWATSGTGNVNIDPLFVDPANYNFSLRPVSTIRYSGSDVVLSTAPTDFFGKKRKTGSISIGAIDYDASPKNLTGTPVKP